MAREHRRSADGLDLPQFLADFASKYTPDHLMGSVLLLRLQREIDDLMSFALGLSPKFHQGYPSPWSHCVLITSPYQANQPTSILDCTIRDKNGKVDWNMPLKDLLSKPLDKQGGIYDGRVDDYADKRVTLFGIKFMPALTNQNRKEIVRSASALKKKGYYYDIPGLLRVLVRLLFDPPLPPPRKGLLHCSGFCQKAYFDALGSDGMFDPSVQWAEDATDDEIWYPRKGTPYPLIVRVPRAARRIAVAAPSVRRKRKPRPKRRARP